MDELKKDTVPAFVPPPQRDLRVGSRATSSSVPSQGCDFSLAFTPAGGGAALTANVVDIQKGAVSVDKLDRKLLGHRVKQSVGSKVVGVEPVIVTVEKGTGTLPELNSTGSITITDNENGSGKSCSDAYVQKLGEEKYEDNNLVTVAITFECNALWVDVASSSSSSSQG